MNILITGGVRSGKSDFALKLARDRGEPVLFVATAEARDDEMRKRIMAHRKSRPAHWVTLEATTGIGRQIEQKIGGAKVVIIDCVTLLVSNILGAFDCQTEEQMDSSSIEQAVTAEIGEIINCMERVAAGFIIISNEVGTGLVPVNKVGRLYRDLLGKANQILAGNVNEVYLMVAGIPVAIKSDKFCIQ